MAKKRVNKTQAIKDALTQNPKASPKEISAMLSGRGLRISAIYVSNIKTKLRAKKKKQTRKKATQSTTKDQVSISGLVKAKRMADEMGGVEKAKEMLETLTKLQ